MGAAARKLWAEMLITKTRLMVQCIDDIEAIHKLIKDDLEEEGGEICQ